MPAGAGAMELTGARELQRTLKALGPKIEQKVTRGAMRKASQPIIKVARANVLSKLKKGKRSGQKSRDLKAGRDRLYRSMFPGVSVKVYKSAGVVFVAVGPSWAHGRHGLMVEFGHRIAKHRTGTLSRITRPGKKRRTAGVSKVTRRAGKGTVGGFVPPHPFMRPAWDMTRMTALGIVNREHRMRVEKEARKAATIKRA